MLHNHTKNRTEGQNGANAANMAVVSTGAPTAVGAGITQETGNQAQGIGGQENTTTA